MLDFLQTTWRFVAGLLLGVKAATQHLPHSWLQHLAGNWRNDFDHCDCQPEGYGYRGMLDIILRTEFPQLQDKVYADHAGATMYTQAQIEAIKQDLGSHLFGNPHSQHGWSGNVGSAAAVAEARHLTLQMCNAPLGEYECVFTAGATGALKLVGEAFPWQDGSKFVYTQDNHNSVLGIRELALDQGATATCVEFDADNGQHFTFTAVSSSMQRPTTQHGNPTPQGTRGLHPKQAASSSSSSMLLHADATTSLQQSQSSSSCSSSSAESHSSWGRDRAAAQKGPCLFAFPMESNFSGTRYAPAVVNHVQTCGLMVANQNEGEERRPAGQHEEAAEGQGWSQSGVKSLSGSDQQQHHQQPCDAEEAQPAVQGLIREEEHQQRQPATIQAKGITGDSNGNKEEARLAPSRPSESEDARWHVLIDAAKACATAPPDLTKHPADFVALSYYKIFGYPTGVGALLVHKRAVPLLMKRKRYFGGGTVAVSLAAEDFVRRREGAAGLEDGTAHYLGIAALSHGFRQLASLGGFPAIARHTQIVTRLFVTCLPELRHANGTPLTLLYGAHNCLAQPSSGSPGAAGQGPVVTFNLLQPDGSYVGYREVEKLAGLHSIFLRTGCFCNPGACARHLGLSASQLKRNYEAGHVCWDDNDIIDGRPTGAVRVSFGWMSSVEDVHAILTFLRTCFLDSAAGAAAHSPTLQDSSGRRPTRQHLSNQNLDGGGLHKSGGLKSTPAAPRFCSPNRSKSSTSGASDHSRQLPSEHVDGHRQPPTGHTACKAHATGFESGPTPMAAPTKQARGSTTPVTDTHTLAQEGTVERSSRSAWLRQLCWVRCGDAVTAWSASQDESQRLESHSQAATSRGGGSGAPVSSSSQQVAAGKRFDAPVVPVSGQQAPSGGQPGVQPKSPAAAPSRQPAHCVSSTCKGIWVSEWPLGPNGLLLDREWALVGDEGHVLTQKALPKLALVQTRVDLEQGFMQISTPAVDTDLVVPLPLVGSETSSAAHQDKPGGSMHVRVCADHVCSLQEVASEASQEEVCSWFQQALGVRCCLVRQRPTSRRAIAPLQPGRENVQNLLGFANEGQFLLMNSASLADMNARITAQARSQKDRTASNPGHLSRFRPNLLVGGTNIAAYAEDDWQQVRIGTSDFFTAGPCARCEMVCMDQTTAVRSGPEPLLTLATYRRRKGRIFLGILLGRSPS
ncbi:hypothetical protein ABBQ38_005687 [Trebouxia sp. C0009 RCD-2024]